MRRALGVELARLRWRRSVVLLLLSAVVVPLLLATTVVWSTRPITDADRADAEQRVAQESSSPGTQEVLAECERRPRRFGVGRAAQSGDPDAVRAACEQAVLPQVEMYLDRPPMRVGSLLGDAVGAAAVVVMALLMILLGATFVGHDWSTASMRNQVLFEPRRLRLWAAKATAVTLVGLVLATVVLAAFWGALYAAQEAQGLSSRPEVAGLVWAQSWRGALLVAAAGLGGYSATMLLRSTVATVGLLFAVAVALPILVAVAGVAAGERLMPQNNVAAWLTGRTTIPQWDDPGCQEAAWDPRDPDFERCNVVIDRSEAAIYLGALTALTAGASAVSFRRRDIG